MPVCAVALSRPEKLLRRSRPSPSGSPPEPAHRQHLLVQAVALGITAEKIAPKTAGPLLHFAIRARWQIDRPPRRKQAAVIGKGHYLQPAGMFLQKRKKLFQPALPIDGLISPRPTAEFFTIIGKHKEARPPFTAALLEVSDGIAGLLERDQVAQPFIDREDIEGITFFFGAVVMIPVCVTGIMKMAVVHRQVLDPSLADGTRQMRLPDPLGEPHPPRLYAEKLLQPGAHHLDLADLVFIGDRRQDRFVVGAAEDLYPAGFDKRLQPPDEIGFLFDDPVQQAAGVMQRHLDRGKTLQNCDKGLVTPCEIILKDLIKIPHRLVIVQRKGEVDPFAFLCHLRLFLSPV